MILKAFLIPFFAFQNFSFPIFLRSGFFIVVFFISGFCVAEESLLSKADFAKANDSSRLVKSKADKGRAKKKSMAPFPSIYRPEVQYWIQFFSQNSNPYLKKWLERSYRYFPIMKSIFRSQALPTELVTVTLVESSLSSHAISSAQAVGYWQFIKSTGLEYGLRIDDWIDERKDFEKSTKAAASYLFQLYQEFDDWLLALSAYNMGEGRLRKLIKKYQSKNFWYLSKQKGFPKETKLYIPKILAASHILKRPSYYGWEEFVVLSPYRYDVFFVPGGTHLKELAQKKGISYKELKRLNPALKKSFIPKSISTHPIRIPKGTGYRISQWLDKKEKGP